MLNVIVLGGVTFGRWASLVAQRLKRLPTMRETRVQSLCREDSPGEGNGNPLQYSCLENHMDGGAWWATVHRAAKELDMTEWLNINNKPLYLLAKVFFSLFCPQECWGPRAGLWWHRESWKWKDSKGITTISYAQGRGHTQKGHQDHTFPFSFLLLPFLLPSNLLTPFQVQAGDCELTTGSLGLAVSPKMRAIGT